MKTEKNNNLPTELDTELQKLSDEEVQGLNEVWDLTGMPSATDFPNPDKLNTIFSAIDEQISKNNREGKPIPKEDREPVRRKRTARIYSIRWLAAAAVIVMGLIGWRSWLSPIQVSAPMGQTASVELHDGSTVELNSGSQIQYSRSFGDVRKVRLNGEAYFDVVNEGRPFIVETFNSSIQVLGTTFNVKAWGDEMKTVVALESGRVEVTGLSSGDDTILLQPGEIAQVQNNSVQLSSKDEGLVPTLLAWRTGDFSYPEEELRVIFRDIERRFDIQIDVASPEVGSLKTKFNRQNPNSVDVLIEEICASMGLSFRTTATGFEVYNPE